LSRDQTDNSYLADKIALRLSMIPQKEILRVIDAFHGKGTIWKNISKKYKGKIRITKIDIENKNNNDFVLMGDNKKYLSSLSLKNYDVIDLDAYGVPYDQLKILFDRGFKGLVFVTFIQSVMGRLSNGLLYDLGFTGKMIDKCPMLLCRNGKIKFLNWLGSKGINMVTMRSHSRRCYLGFEIK